MQKQTPDQAKKMLRRSLALIAVCAIIIGGTKIADSRYSPGIGFSTVQTAAADPTGPTGSPGGPDGGMNGSQFQPPGLPPQMPDYQGGNNQPPLDQNSGISIYNSGAPQAGQQAGGQQGSQQQPQQAQQPQHGTQIPDYQTATPYTQGPGRANPDYQAPQQNSPQQGQTPQQGQQQQPSQAPSQTQQPSSDDQQDQEIQRQCESASQEAYPDPQILSSGGSGSLLNGPGRIGGPMSQGCIWCPKQQGPGQRFAQSRAPESVGPEPNNQCSSVGPGVFDDSSGVADMSAVQLKNASFIFSVWIISNLPILGAKLFPDPLTEDEERLLMTEAVTESGLYNFANDGSQRSHSFNDAKETPEIMQESYNFDWDAMGCDAGSMGMFQQNAPLYGMAAQLMDRATSTHIALYGSDAGDGGPLVENKDGLFCVTRGPEFCKVPGREAGGLSRDDVAAIWNDTRKDFAVRAGAVIQWIQVSGPADYSSHVEHADQIIAALKELAHK